MPKKGPLFLFFYYQSYNFVILNELVLLFLVPIKHRSCPMETKSKTVYESPAAEVLEMKVERSICQFGSETEVTSYRTDYENRGELTWD